MDQLVAARRPTLADLRTDYSQALMQRNSLVSRIRSGNAARSSIEPWDQRLAAIGADLAKSRSEAVEAIAGAAAVTASELGLEGELSIIHRPGCSLEQEAFLTELREGLDGDIERGFTVRGPHRDDLLIRRGGRDLKSHGSQGEKRLSVLSLLLAERDMIAEARGSVPLLLLDDVMSELDAERRGLLARRIESAGQCVVTATEFEHIPDLGETPIARVRVSSSGVTQLRAA
jgi:DNA replication and repair protein RecF